MTVFHRKWKFIFDWQLIDASAAIQNDFRGKDCLWESLHIYCFPKRSMSVYVIFLPLEPGFLSYDFAMETHRPRKCPWANSKKRKKRKTQKTRKAWQRKHVVASLHQTKVHIIGNGRQNLPIYEKSIGASRQNILRTEERGLLNVWTDFNRNSDSESPDDCDENYSLIPNNIVRAQTTLKRTASVITAIRWNTL